MKNKKDNLNINAVDMVRKIRDRNYKITKNMTTAEKLAYIHKHAEMVNKEMECRSKTKGMLV
jgi:hypothetical protein